MASAYIRSAEVADAQAICRLHIRSVRQLCADAYSPTQLDAWIGNRIPAHYEPFLKEAVCLVAETSGALAGFAILDPALGEVHALYVDPDSVGKSIGTQLLMAIEDHARTAGRVELALNATLNSVSFYERHGYTCQGPATNEIPRGSSLPCMRMAKRLVAA